MSRFLIIVVLVYLSLSALGGCGYPKHIDPPLYTYDLDSVAKQSAVLHARDVNGIWLSVQNTHSMEPLLQGGDYVVIQTGVFAPLKERRKGEVINYLADWQPNGPTVCHRIVDIDPFGLLAEGDNVDGQHSESHWRVTDENYRGLVVGIYRVKK